MIKQSFFDAINADPEDRVPQLIYADWLEMDPDVAEGWRVLVERNRMPGQWAVLWRWRSHRTLESPRDILPMELVQRLRFGSDTHFGYSSFFSAMNDAAICWSRWKADGFPNLWVPPKGFRLLPNFFQRT